MKGPAAGPAELVYDDGEFHVRRQGSFVLCAVSGKPIALHELKYWSVTRQEAYASGAIALQRSLAVAAEK